MNNQHEFTVGCKDLYFLLNQFQKITNSNCVRFHGVWKIGVPG